MEQKKASRKDYRKQSSQYFLIGLIVALSSTLLAFEYRTETLTIIEPIDFDGGVIYEPEVQKMITLPVKKEVKPTLKLKKIDLRIINEPLISIIEPTKHKMAVVNTDTSLWSSEPLVAEEEPLYIAEIMPSFKGGECALYEFLGKNMKYPAMASGENLEAKIYVQFIINEDGSISDIEVLRGEGFGFDEEAKRVINAMPDWNPGKQGGKNVRVKYVIPIIFTLM